MEMENKRPLCSICKQNPGSIHILNDINGSKSQQHLCEECASKMKKKNFPNNPLESLLDVFDSLFDGNGEEFNEPETRQPKRRNGSNSKQKSYLDNFCVNVTSEAEEGRLDPIIGREREIDRLINILNRRTKNNPVLIGEPGVGKTAIVEGLALKIAEGNVPSKLRNKRIYTLDITAVTAGTMYRGMFEERLKKIIKEVEKNKNILLFVDEMHLLMGAGSSMDSNMDAANILKPYLTRGQIQIIGATTLEEYREIEKDAALERRFQTITIGEPNLEETFAILRGLKSKYEEFHGITYSDDVLHACVHIANRYIFDRFMPDKAIDLMDEVGARLNLRHNISNQSISDRIYDLLEKERTLGEQKRFEEANEVKMQRIALERNGRSSNSEKYEASVEEIKTIAQEITGIPVTDLSDSDKNSLLQLEERLKEHVIGQEKAVEQVVRAVKRNRLNLRKKQKPTVFLFAGPTGVGKTELTKRLAEDLFGDEKAMIRFDMSEFMESHSVSKLIGSPPGYVGYEKSGKLTEQIRRRPYSVILLDEFEKAHPEVQHIFLQVFDDGRLTDAQGKTVDFSHTIIIMTSNLGATAPKTTGFHSSVDAEHYLKAIHGYFKPEFINRIDSIIPFGHLSKDDILQIVDLMVDDIRHGLEEHGVTLELADGVSEWLAEKGYDEKFGARPLYRAITTYIEDIITDYLLEHEEVETIRIELGGEELKPVVANLTDFV